MSDELDKALAPVASAVGADIKEAGKGRELPWFNLSESVGKGLGRDLGLELSQHNIYLQGKRVVTVDERGNVEEMTPDCFCSWVEDYVTTYKYVKKEDKNVVMTMAKDLARKILSSRQFKSTLRELKGVHRVRMPVFRASGGVELLDPGFDSESGIYTLDQVKYSKNMTLEEARCVFEKYLKGFPWGDLGQDENALFRNRSVAVQVAAMLSVYIRGMFEPGTKKPLITYIANQPGTGKSLLAVMAIAPIYGYVMTTDKPRDENEFKKTLDTFARCYAPYAFFDDIGLGIFSNSLNRFLTSAWHTGRSMGGNSEMFEVPAVTQCFATGNKIKLTPDLQRRALIIDMFLAGEVRGRTFDFRLTESYLGSDESRAELLAAYWAVVRTWSEEKGRVRVENPLESFEEFTSVLGALVRVAGFDDPLQKPDLPDGGDEKGRMWRFFLSRLAGDEIMDGEETRDFTTAQALEKAEELAEEGYFDISDLVGSAKDKSVAFGKGMAEWKEREILDSKGRLVQFGKRRDDRKRFYKCVVLKGAE